ncbi:MAG TPA: carboxypeptidase regulatory-like domain-containing protein, partial [Dissulfurispiraceae bacterium]|nr:carboxypeptidase regulatory-like domain-containing protein [Dissulfurispiraceae bacterium]
PITVPAYFNVSGYVYETDGSTGITGATVILQQNGITKYVATSGPGGAYSFSGTVPYGTFTISAYAAGYTFTPASISITAATTTENVQATF